MPLQGCQIRMARAALGVSLAELARVSGVNEKTIRRCEAAMGSPSVATSTLTRLKTIFESCGLSFSQTPRPCVCLEWNPNEEAAPGADLFQVEPITPEEDDGDG